MEEKMKVREIVERLLDNICGNERITHTCDIQTTGDPDMEVTGIVTTFMATVDVIRKTIETGANFIITHEPTWFNGKDDTDWCENDSVYLTKKKLLEENHIAVWRFHDHMHFGSSTDYIYTGMQKEMGWENYLQPDEMQPWVYEMPETTLRKLALELKERFEMDVIQIIGRPDTRITRAGLLVGGGSLGLGREVMPMEVMERNQLNVLICGDITEWTTCAYVNDAQQLGFDRAMIVLGHERSEEAGMKHLVPVLRPLVGDIPVTFINAGEPFAYL